MRTSRALAGIALVPLAVVVLGACSDDNDASRDASGAVTKAGKVSVFELRPADCLHPPADLSGEIDSIEVVPCADAHTQEVFAQVAATDQAYPGAEVLATEANGRCIGAMQGEPLNLSPDDGYFVSYLLPSFDGWNNDGDRNIVCVFVFPQQGEVTGSVVDQAEAGTIKPGEPPPVVAVPPTLEGGS